MNAVVAPVPRLLLDINEAAEAISCSRSTIYNLAKAGSIELVSLGRRSLVVMASLEAYVDSLRNQDAGGAIESGNPRTDTPRDSRTARHDHAGAQRHPAQAHGRHTAAQPGEAHTNGHAAQQTAHHNAARTQDGATSAEAPAGGLSGSQAGGACDRGAGSAPQKVSGLGPDQSRRGARVEGAEGRCPTPTSGP